MPVLLNFFNCFVPIKEQEVEPVLYSFSALFTILTSYFLLLPLREDAGISLGTSTLPKLFACSLIVTLVVTPAVTAYINSKGQAQGRDAALRQSFRVLALVLLGFFVLYNFSLVEGWVDKLSTAQQHMPSHSSHLTHPLDALLHHRQQQQQSEQQNHQHQQPAQHPQPQQAEVGYAVYHPTIVSGSAEQLQGASHHPQLQQQHMQGGSHHQHSHRHRHKHEQQQEQLLAAAQQQHQDEQGQAQDQQWVKRRMRQLLQTGSNPDAATQPTNSAAASSSPPSNPSGSGSKGGVNSHTGDETLTKHQRRLRASFYVSINVMNLVGISSLWAKCADAFSPEAGARLFGFISAGATLGQLAGSLIAMLASWLAGAMLTSSQPAALDRTSGSTKAAAPASSLLLVAAMLQLASAQFVTRIRPVAAYSGLPAAARFVDSSRGLGGDRAEQALLSRRSGTGGKAAGSMRSTAAVTAGALSTQGHATRLACSTAAPTGSQYPQYDRAAAAADASIHSNGSSGSLGQNSCREGDTSGIRTCDLGGAEQEGGSSSTPTINGVGASSGGRIGGKAYKVLHGFHLIWRSPYLLLVCSNLLLTYVVGSLMYFQRALVVSAAAATHGPAFRTAFFAALNTWSAAAILLMQLFATSSLLRRMGMSVALGLAPVICLAALFGIVSSPLPWVVAVSEVLRKVFGYAVLRPAREVLFTVVSREEKYSAKLVIDTVIQRLGDALAAAVFQVLDVQYSLGQAGVGAAGCVMCVVWLATALALGRKHKQLASNTAALKV